MKLNRWVLSLLMVLAIVFITNAEEKEKKTTLRGRLVCGKCTLKITDGCSNVLEVVKGDKKLHYILDDKAKKEAYHKGICPPDSETKNVLVTGVVYKKGDQLHVKEPDVKLSRKKD